MATEIITTEDLQIFKNELLDDIKKLFNSKNDPTAKKWLKSYEVRQLLKKKYHQAHCRIYALTGLFLIQRLVV